MELYYNGARTYIKQASRKETDRVSRYLSYTDQNAVMRNRFGKGAPLPEQISCFDPISQSFPTGLLPMLIDKFDEESITKVEPLVEVIEPQEPNIPDWRWEHQEDLVRYALEAKRCIGQSPTGSGKTSTIAFFLSAFPEATCLVIVPRNGILKNTKKTIESHLDETVGEFSGQKKEFNRITVATINSLYQKVDELEFLKDVDVLVVDECHNITDGMYTKVSDAIPNRSYSWGLSATPYRQKGDEYWMYGVCGSHKRVVSEQELINKGIIQKPKYCIVQFDHPLYEGKKNAKVMNHHGQRVVVYDTPNGKPERDEIYHKGITVNKERNEAIIELFQYYLDHLQRNGTGLILFNYYEQGEFLYSLSDNTNFNIQYADGRTNNKDRLQIVEGLRSGEIDGAIASKILNEGEDIPNLELIIIAGGGASNRNLTQQVGRVIRNKAKALVIDFYDDEEWYLKNNSKKRQSHIQNTYPGSVSSVDSLHEVRGFIDEQLRRKD